MKKLFVILAALLAIALPQAAKAVDVEGIYVGGLAGLNFLSVGGSSHHHRHHKDRYKIGWLGGLDLGYRMCNGIRAEAEVSYRGNKHKHAHRPVHTWSFMANGYYEINPCCWCITPFIGAGVGYDRTKHRTCRREPSIIIVDGIERRRHRHKDNKNGFAWQLMAGGFWELDECLEAVIKYCFHKGHIKNHYNNTVEFGINLFF